MAEAPSPPPKAEAAEALQDDFRRLIEVLEAERAAVEGADERMARERAAALADVRQLRKDTEEWCLAERKKIEAEWRRLDQLTEKVRELWPSRSTDVLEINCSGKLFSVPRSILCSAEGSKFSRLFEEESAGEMTRDEAGQLLVDFDPDCFRIVVEHLQNRRLNVNAPLPVVPAALRRSMELLAEAWDLAPVLRLENRLNPVHGTSLQLSGRSIRSTHPGWQLISAQDPLPLSAPGYFEVRVVESPDPRGGVAVGVCGRLLQGEEVHTLSQRSSALYNSHNGLLSDCVDGAEGVRQGAQLLAGSVFGVRHDVQRNSLEWYLDGALLGECTLKLEWLERMRSLYPVIGLYGPGQAVEVNFLASAPERVP